MYEIMVYDNELALIDCVNGVSLRYANDNAEDAFVMITNLLEQGKFLTIQKTEKLSNETH